MSSLRTRRRIANVCGECREVARQVAEVLRREDRRFQLWQDGDSWRWRCCNASGVCPDGLGCLTTNHSLFTEHAAHGGAS